MPPCGHQSRRSAVQSVICADCGAIILFGKRTCRISDIRHRRALRCRCRDAVTLDAGAKSWGNEVSGQGLGCPVRHRGSVAAMPRMPPQQGQTAGSQCESRIAALIVQQFVLIVHRVRSSS